jgi:hypothetical protein
MIKFNIDKIKIENWRMSKIFEKCIYETVIILNQIHKNGFDAERFEIVKTHLNQAMKVTPVLATSSLSASSTVPLGAGTTKLLISKPVNGNIEREKKTG